MIMRLPLSLLVLLVSLLPACGYFKEKPDETREWSVTRFYAEARAALNREDYEKAIEYYEGLQTRYPFGPFSQQAQLEIAYAYFKFNEAESAVAATERFIELYPAHPHIAYAYYLKGLANFNRTAGLIERYVPLDMTQRDPGSARDAFADFSTLLSKFPDSRYARDARQRMIFLRNKLAMYDVHVAGYYLKRGVYLAAANRSSAVVEGYQRTPAIPYALRIMVDAYAAMDMVELSEASQRVLELNYPYHPAFTAGAYRPKREGGGLMWAINLLEE